MIIIVLHMILFLSMNVTKTAFELSMYFPPTSAGNEILLSGTKV